MANPFTMRCSANMPVNRTPFLHLPDGASSPMPIFWADGADRQCADRFGLKPGDRVAAQVAKSPEALALYAACVQAGLIFLPLNTAYTVDELTYFIENSGALSSSATGPAKPR
jgi:malonyl-CoA/methylmalonyl-CoA synthetase